MVIASLISLYFYSINFQYGSSKTLHDRTIASFVDRVKLESQGRAVFERVVE